MSWLLRKTLSAVKLQLEEAGVKETEAGRYDLRDFAAIRRWLKKSRRDRSLKCDSLEQQPSFNPNCYEYGYSETCPYCYRLR